MTEWQMQRLPPFRRVTFVEWCSIRVAIPWAI
jgi:hypothetical protein